MDRRPPEWHITETRDELRYLGHAMARVQREPDGTVSVNTCCYSEGFTHTRRMATAAGGRRYVEAWMRKWGAQAMHDLCNKVAAAQIEAEYSASLPKVEIKPDPKKPRRGKRAW